MPPKLRKQGNTPKPIEQTHKLLSRFTHRFEVRIRDQKTGKPLTKNLAVKLGFTHKEWERTFTLERFRKDKREIYGKNVKLGEKGAYTISTTISGLVTHPVRARFSFDFDPESVKGVMRDLEKSWRSLAGKRLSWIWTAS